MLPRPAASTAAAAEAPAGTMTVRPSTVTAIVAAELSGRFLNIEAPGGKRRQNRVERPRRDHRREQIGVRAGERDAAVAIGGEGAREALRSVVDRQPVGRHDAE